MKTFSKILSANDLGQTGGHQGGIHIPKSEAELLAFLPALDSSIKNPDAWIVCQCEDGSSRRFRYIHYNNRMHDLNGTRNEYRITHMTTYFREIGAEVGDIFEISQKPEENFYNIKVIPIAQPAAPEPKDEIIRIKISAAWSRTH